MHCVIGRDRNSDMISGNYTLFIKVQKAWMDKVDVHIMANHLSQD